MNGRGEKIRPVGREMVQRWMADAAYYLAGCLLYSASVTCFSQPNHIVNGGVTGISLLLNELIGAPVGLTVWLLNVPLFCLAFWKLGFGFTLRTVVCTTLCSALIDGLQPVLPAFRGDPVLVALFGGLLSGTGLGLLYLRGATSGGMDIVSRLLELSHPHFSMGRLMLALDACVVGLSAVVFRNVELSMYALLMIFVGSHLIDTVLYGRSGGKLVLVATQREEAVTQRLLRELRRGVTRLTATGGYTGEQRGVLLCAVSRAQLYVLYRLVWDTDPDAFLVTVSADEVFGRGFLPAKNGSEKKTKKKKKSF